MYDISNLDEAREILAKPALTPEDSRRLLNYLIGRDEAYRSGFKKVEALTVASLESIRVLMVIVDTLVPQPGPEVQAFIKEAVASLQKAHDLLGEPDPSVH